MKKNVGKIDSILRFFFGIFLVWLGLFYLQGLKGEIVGIIVAMISIIPFTISATKVCPVFTILKISSISKKEKQ
jgi:uncharacterized membrane protein